MSKKMKLDGTGPLKIDCVDRGDGQVAIEMEIPLNPGRICDVLINGKRIIPEGMGISKAEIILTAKDKPKVKLEGIPHERAR